MARIGGNAGDGTDKQLEDCTVANAALGTWLFSIVGAIIAVPIDIKSAALGTWLFSIAGALIAIPVGIKRKSLGPLVFFGTTGTMLDIIMGINQCEREHAEHQMKLLEGQKLTTESQDSAQT